MSHKGYQPEAWRDVPADDVWEIAALAGGRRPEKTPGVIHRGLLLELLGRINYQIVTGNRVYLQVGGIVYKALFGGYWRSVFTGVEHYSLKCEELSSAVLATDGGAVTVVDLPIEFSDNSWTTGGHSLSFLLSRDPDQLNLGVRTRTLNRSHRWC